MKASNFAFKALTVATLCATLILGDVDPIVIKVYFPFFMFSGRYYLTLNHARDPNSSTRQMERNCQYSPTLFSNRR